MKIKKNMLYLIILFIVFAVALGFFATHIAMNKNDNIQEIDKHTLYIQGVTDISVLTSIKSSLIFTINNIIKEELGLASDYNFDFFLPKDRQRLTLYCLNDVNIKGVSFVESGLDSVLKENLKDFVLQNVKLMPQINLFGDNKDELVIMVDDPDKELSFLNQRIKLAMYSASERFMYEYSSELYDILRSERFDYLPHIGLGRIRSTSIKQHIKNTLLVDEIYSQIMQRILDETSLVVIELSSKNDINLTFNMLCIFDPKLRTYKDYQL